ncbi:MAG: hypothetical protein AAF193_00330 [Bacteroidota bacterium]
MKTIAMIMALGLAMSGPMRPISNEYVLIHGNVQEIQLTSDDIEDAQAVRCIVYREGEIYVAFKTDESGDYLFNLPVGYDYELVFGGDDYVNKRITMDVTNLPAEKKGVTFKCDMRVFKANPEIKQLSVFDDPVAKFNYDKRTRKVLPDLEYLDEHSWDVEKAMKKIAKQMK